MPQKEFFLCHAGDTDLRCEDEGLPLKGAVYVWEGEWVLTHEEVEERDINPVMKLKPLFRNAQKPIEGDIGAFTRIELPLSLQR